ncbi:helix-turn-helix domain-containing protein [Lentilactobacillus senioris]|uniref:helix-turn-helix domain-containing protein n=1 Tax=Lentilactobacillus senioris TaxID=931534 RepID=UPI0006CFC873|nr:helix-turn-helix transcriptional regulator [Lentilactobacillus senioris]
MSNTNRLSELRKKENLSQSALAKIAGGVTPQSISLYEKGQREPKIKTWNKLADYFNVSVSYLMGIDEESDYYDNKTMAKKIAKLFEPEKKTPPKELGEMYQQDLDYFTKFYNNLLENKKFDQLETISRFFDVVKKAYK